MSVRPSPGVKVPALTARMARASNPAGTTAIWGARPSRRVVEG